MSPPIEVRRLTAHDDLSAVVALQDASFHMGWGLEALRRELADGAVGRVYVLNDEGRTVAFCACWVVAGEWHINSLAVAVDMRRRGYGRRLLASIGHQLVREGVRAATLEVRRGNTAALALYAALGFVVEGERRDYYEAPREDALVLWCHALADAVGKW
jgi:ribosomal-protein-alanine N-acetyltransferase